MLFFVPWTLFTTAVDSRPEWAKTVVISTMFGLMSGITSAHRNHRAVAPLLAGIASSDHHHVAEALRGGPAPSDPVILRASAQLAHLRFAQSVNSRKYSVIFAVAGVVSLIVFGDSHTLSPAGYLMASLFGAAGVFACINPPRLQSRAVLLTEAAGQIPPATV